MGYYVGLCRRLSSHGHGPYEFRLSKYCDYAHVLVFYPAQSDKSTITENCEWNGVIRNLLSKVFEVHG